MKEKLSLSVQKIERLIHVIRGQKVMLDAGLAEMYGVETRVLKQAVRRNQKRFPNDFKVNRFPGSDPPADAGKVKKRQI